jgi:hypothetical protein
MEDNSQTTYPTLYSKHVPFGSSFLLMATKHNLRGPKHKDKQAGSKKAFVTVQGVNQQQSLLYWRRLSPTKNPKS